jgi:hypothetical protein
MSYQTSFKTGKYQGSKPKACSPISKELAHFGEIKVSKILDGEKFYCIDHWLFHQCLKILYASPS